MLSDTAFGSEFFHCCALHLSPVSSMCRWPALCLRALTVSVLERPAASWNAYSVSGRTLSYLETSGSGAVSGGYVSVGETSVERNCFQMFGGKKKTQKTCYLNMNSVYVAILLYGHSENIRWQQGLSCWLLFVGSGRCLQGCVHLLRVSVVHGWGGCHIFCCTNQILKFLA